MTDSEIRDLAKDLKDCRVHFYLDEDGETFAKFAPSFLDGFCGDCLKLIDAEQRARVAGQDHAEIWAEFELAALSDEEIKALLRGWYRWVRDLASKPEQGAKFSFLSELAHRILEPECRRRGLGEELKKMQYAILGARFETYWASE